MSRTKPFAMFVERPVHARGTKGEILQPKWSVVKSGCVQVDMKFLCESGAFLKVAPAHLDTGAMISFLPRQIVNRKKLLLQPSQEREPLFAKLSSSVLDEFQFRRNNFGRSQSSLRQRFGSILEVKTAKFQLADYPHREFDMTCAITECGEYPLLGMPELLANFRLEEGERYHCPGFFLHPLADHPYRYYTPYHRNIAGMLQKLREKVFQVGAYNPFVPFPGNILGGKVPVRRIGTRPPNIATAVTLAGRDGTHSILDLDHISTTPERGAVCLVNDVDLEEYFGTTEPTRKMVEGNHRFLEHLQPGQGTYVIYFENGTPSGICFAGFPF